jgi:hypothetical protein
MLALCAALVTYLGVQIAVSAGADSAYEALVRYHARLEANVNELTYHHDRLVATAELYRSDRRAVALAAREHSYYHASERVIRIPGRPVSTTPLSPGTIVRNRHTPANHRAVGGLSALLVFLLATFVQIVAQDESLLAHRTRRASR